MNPKKLETNTRSTRNLTPDAFRLALGRRYNRTKRSVGRPKNEDNLSQLSPAEELSGSTRKEAAKTAEIVRKV
jgi:hypothetical protein